MIIFWTSNGTGSPWLAAVPFLIFIASVLLQGLFDTGVQSGQSWSPVAVSTWHYDSQTGWTHSSFEPRPEQTGWGAGGSLISLLFITVLAFGTFKLIQQLRREGVTQTLRRILAPEVLQRPGPRGPRHGAAPLGNQQRAPSTAEEKRQRFEALSAAVHKLQTEAFLSRRDLDALPLAQLKAKLRERGVVLKANEALDRSDAVQRILDAGGSSSASCSICCEDYESGDVLRKLACGHRFHLECVDRWFLSSGDYSRPAACPMCNAELL